MEIKKHIYTATAVLMVMLLVSGCSWLRNFGNVRIESVPGKEVTIQELKENWYDYYIYYAGYYGSLSLKHPSAILFDPKGDDKVLIGDRWTRVPDQETLSKLIISIEGHKAMYPPNLRRILGPDDQLYGYFFSGLRYVPTKMVDDRTLWVYDLPTPPYMRVPNIRNIQVSGKVGAPTAN